jgi:hypothetical protein
VIVFRGTQKLLKELRLRKEKLGDPGEGFMGSWFANVFRLERRNSVLITNDRTLYSVLLWGLRRPDFDDLGSQFVAGLAVNLRRDGFDTGLIASVSMACHPIQWAATNNRSVLGSMNDLISCSKYLVGLRRQATEREIANLNCDLNRTPMSALKHIVAMDEMRLALKEWSP